MGIEDVAADTHPARGVVNPGYGAIACSLHWVIAALAVTVVSLGWALEWAAPNTPPRASILFVHRSVGLLVLVLMVTRAGWRGRHPPPPLPLSVGGVEARLAHLTHIGLYLIFIAMPLSGYLNTAAAGHNLSFFGLFLIPAPNASSPRLAQWAIAFHLVGQYLVYTLVVLHVAGALYHGLIRRDGVLERMLPRRRRVLINRAPTRRG